VSVGLYSRWVLPRLIDLAMRSRALAPERLRIVPLAAGKVLEVGFGSGLNLPYYGKEITEIWAVDPSAELWRLARSRVDRVRVPIHYIQGSAERLPFASGVFDSVLMTWTLCSIPAPAIALTEMTRVLKPGGELVFVEHGLAPDRSIRRWQDRLTPAWSRIAGGCQLNRPIPALLADAGFQLAELDEGYGEGPKPFAYLYRGFAVRPLPEGVTVRSLPSSSRA
jgi:ubiquinone/menaquinone biosynthesis C-methylase UbiE